MSMSGLHVTFRKIVETRRIFDHCPTCERRTRKWGEYEHWFGWTVTCTICGERWENGDRCPRPFERGWRARQAEWARKQYQVSLVRKEAPHDLRQ